MKTLTATTTAQHPAAGGRMAIAEEWPASILSGLDTYQDFNAQFLSATAIEAANHIVQGQPVDVAAPSGGFLLAEHVLIRSFFGFLELHNGTS